MLVKTKSFQIDPWVWSRFPGMKLVCVAGDGLDNTTPQPKAGELLTSAQNRVRRALAGRNFDQYEPFSVWRGVQPGKSFPAAHEALGLRVAGEKPLRSINSLVDCYNAVSLEFLAQDIAAPIGAWDSDELPMIRLIETEGGEPFIELGKDTPVKAMLGEVAYANEDRTQLVTKNFVWRQARLGAVASSTSAFFVVSELLPPFARSAEMVLDRLVDVISDCFGITPASKILAEPETVWTWEGENE